MKFRIFLVLIFLPLFSTIVIVKFIFNHFSFLNEWLAIVGESMVIAFCFFYAIKLVKKIFSSHMVKVEVYSAVSSYLLWVLFTLWLFFEYMSKVFLVYYVGVEILLVIFLLLFVYKISFHKIHNKRGKSINYPQLKEGEYIKWNEDNAKEYNRLLKKTAFVLCLVSSALISGVYNYFAIYRNEEYNNLGLIYFIGFFFFTLGIFLLIFFSIIKNNFIKPKQYILTNNGIYLIFDKKILFYQWEDLKSYELNQENAHKINYMYSGSSRATIWASLIGNILLDLMFIFLKNKRDVFVKNSNFIILNIKRESFFLKGSFGSPEYLRIEMPADLKEKVESFIKQKIQIALEN